MAGCASYPAPAPAAAYQETSLVVQPDPLSAIMNRHSTFILEQIQTMSGCIQRSTMVHVLDETGDSIMSTMLGTALGTSHHGDQVRTSSFINFMDNTGRIVMTVTQTGASMTITSGDRMLGVVDGCIGLCAGGIVPKNLNRLPLCAVHKIGDDYKFVRPDGMEIGRAILNSVGALELRLSPTLDANTKAILLVTGYMLYYLYFVQTSCGMRGTRRCSIYLCLLLGVTPMVVLAIIAGVLIGVFDPDPAHF